MRVVAKSVWRSASVPICGRVGAAKRMRRQASFSRALAPPRDEEFAPHKRDLARLKKERDFCAKRQSSFSQSSRLEVSGDSMLSQKLPDTPYVPASGYYAWVSRPKTNRAKANQHLFSRIREIHDDSDGILDHSLCTRTWLPKCKHPCSSFTVD